MAASEAIQAELERIALASDGRLRASTVLDSAKHKSSPLHDYFEWDDGAAAHQHRLWQARQLIKSIHIVRVDGAPAGPMYVHIRNLDQSDSREGYYAPVADLDRDEWQIAMADASRRVAQAQQSVDVLLTYAKTAKRISKVKAASKHLERASGALVSVGV